MACRCLGGLPVLWDQAGVEGRPDLPKRLVRELCTALTAGHPERAAEVAADLDWQELNVAPGSGSVDNLVSGYEVIGKCLCDGRRGEQ